MKILHVVASLKLAYGGPARSVPALARALREHGCETTVWAPDESGGGDGSLEGYDLIHDHGIWMPHNWRLAKEARRRGVPRIVSPRGMLEPWALQHKRWKKRVAWWLYQRRDLADAACLHATAEAEARNIRRLLPGVAVALVPNGAELPETVPAKQPSPDGRRTALFLGRIYPVKGLPVLVEAWRRARPRGWRMEIAGPDEAGHRREVEQLIQKAGLGDDFHFTGPLEDAAKTAAFARAELFVLPSHSENFGMAVAEALAHGLPVLTTTGAPWPMLESEGCGWTVETVPEALASGLRTATTCDPATLSAMGSRGRMLIAAKFSWPAAATAMLSVYRWVLNRGNPPPEILL